MASGIFSSHAWAADAWEPVNNGLTSLNVQAIAIDGEERIFAGTRGEGIFLSTDKGENWNVVLGPEIYPYFTEIIIDNDGVIFAATGRGVFRSTNHGDEWMAVNSGLTIIDPILVLGFNRLAHVFAGYDGSIFRTNDAGENWMETVPPTLLQVFSLMLSDSGVMFAGTSSNLEQGSIYRSLDDGDTWQWVFITELGRGNDKVISLIEGPTGDIFAGTHGFRSMYSLFRSSDLGITWIDVSPNFSPLPNGIVRTMAVRPSGDLFAGFFNGVYRTADNGETWTDVSSGIEQQDITEGLDITELAVTPDGTLFAATAKDGVFRLTDNFLPPASVNKDIWSPLE